MGALLSVFFFLQKRWGCAHNWVVLRLCFGLRGILFCTLLLVEHISSLVILIEGDGFGGFSFFLFTFNVDMQALVTLLTSLQILAFSLF